MKEPNLDSTHSQPLTKLKATRLNGKWAVMPEGGLGTMGWHPKAWTVAYARMIEHAIPLFLVNNKNWKADEILGVEVEQFFIES